jgi:4-hydroxy-tetrahydrodipicolinate synthase
MTQLQGIMPVLATPFDDAGWIDFAGFSAVIESAIANGASALVMFGLASEYYKLDDGERDALTAVLVGTVRDRVPVIVSITDHCTELAVRRAQAAQRAGASALMVLPPFFLAPSPSSVLSHIRSISNSVQLPLVLQLAPRETGLSIDILETAPVSAVKVDAHPSAPILRSLPKDKASFVGYMGIDLPDAVAGGCSGCMPTTSLVAHFVRVWKELNQRDDKGRMLHTKMRPLLEFMMQSVEFLIAAEKHLLVRKGLIGSAFCRRPASYLTGAQLDDLFRLADMAV